MKTIKPLITLLFLCWLYSANAGNACFGAMNYHSNAYETNPNYLGFQSDYILEPGWVVISETWHFGDGDTASGPQIHHTYANGDTAHIACLVTTAYNASLAITCTDTLCKGVKMCSSTVDPDFVPTIISNVLYINENIGGDTSDYPLEFIYNYGDETQAIPYTKANLLTPNLQTSHTYNQAGIYLFTIYVVNASGCIKDTAILITVGEPCNTYAYFDYLNTSGNTYQFSDYSSSTAGHSASWQFKHLGVPVGSSNSHDPIYTFTYPAGNSATLRIQDSVTGCLDSITVLLPESDSCNTTASFTYQGGGALNLYQFNSTSSGNNLKYAWTFYGGVGGNTVLGTNDVPNPSFTYTMSPHYARLIVMDSVTGCADTLRQQLYCNINASFTYQNISGNTYQFTNLSTNSGVQNPSWTYYNGNTMIGLDGIDNPVFVFAGAGPFTARLIIYSSTDPQCSDTMIQQLPMPGSSCITLQPGAAAGIDAVVFSLFPDSALGGSHEDFMATQWTYSGVPAEVRSYLKFDLSAIPAGATITSAKLSLYAAPNSSNSYAGKPTFGSNNASYLRRVTATWGENAVKWNSQPTSTTSGQVLLSQATNTAQSYLNIDVQAFTQTWINNPAQNYGLVLDMISTSYYNALVFGSSDNTNAAIRPKLEICYTTPCGVTANFTSTTGNDTVVLTNLSNGSNGTYIVNTSYASSNAPYSADTGTFNDIKTLALPADTIMKICLTTFDSLNTCSNTFCNTVFTGICSVVADFTYTVSGSTVIVYNNSTFNYGTTFQWNTSGTWPNTSTQVNDTFQYPQQGPHQICLIARNTAGCSDTLCLTVTTTPPIYSDTLCGMVFNDANSNGIYDFGESVRPNSAVNIDGITHYTDNTGFYHAGVTSSNHVVALNAPPGWVQTYPDTPLVYNISTGPGDYICGLDFGMRDDTLILSGIVYNDNNNNGIYDSGDTVRIGVPVVISGMGGSYTVYTNSSGYYSSMVYSGTYTISYATPSGYVQTQPLSTAYTVTAYNTSINGLNFGVRNNNVVISGIVFSDANNNGAYDVGESGIAGQRVFVGSVQVYTNASGYWSITRPTGTYVVTYTPTGSYSGYTVTTPSSITINATVAGAIYTSNAFGVNIPAGTGDVCITLSQITNVTPALGLAKYTIKLQNYGAVTMSGILEMNYDPILTYHSANVGPASVNGGGHTATWNVTVGVGQTVYIRPNFSVASSATLGTNVFNYVFYNPDAGFTDVNMACNEDTIHQQVLASYDPNDKYVSPIGIGSTHAIRNVGEKLDYTIMFQNTGSAPAVNVILRDTVEDDLDIASLEMRDASHNYHVQVEGREIIWIFSNIMLPDSNTSVDSSMGFVSFSMNANTELAEGTLVTNNAGIYFDYNDVVATGTAFNTIDKNTSIQDIENGADIVLQPNPFTTYTNLVVTGGNSKSPYTLKIVDVTGRIVQQLTSATNTIHIERDGMAQGVYMYEVKQNGKLIGNGRMIAQ